ncbi:MAG: hypothetical protein VB141_10545 [Burkholderia gladioli]
MSSFSDSGMTIDLLFVESLALKVLEEKTRRETRSAIHFYLMVLRPTLGKLEVKGYTRDRHTLAVKEYAETERSINGEPGSDAVLVAADSLEALRMAYPNYFLDTQYFILAVEEMIRQISKRGG